MPEMWDDLYIEDNRSLWTRIVDRITKGTPMDDTQEIMNDGSMRPLKRKK